MPGCIRSRRATSNLPGASESSEPPTACERCCAGDGRTPVAQRRMRPDQGGVGVTSDGFSGTIEEVDRAPMSTSTVPRAELIRAGLPAATARGSRRCRYRREHEVEQGEEDKDPRHQRIAGNLVRRGASGCFRAERILRKRRPRRTPAHKYQGVGQRVEGAAEKEERAPDSLHDERGRRGVKRGCTMPRRAGRRSCATIEK